MRKLTICHNSMISYLRGKLTQDQPLAFMNQVLPFDAVLFPHHINESLDIIQHYHNIQALKLKQLGNYFSHPQAVIDALSFAQELALYGLSVNDCPHETEIDREIINVLMTLNITLPDLRDELYYAEHSLSHAQNSYLTRMKAIQIETPTQPTTTIHFKNALNFRQEIEGLIQNLITEKISNATILVPDLNEAIPLFNAVFSRYQIPIEYGNNSFEVIKSQLLAFLDYYFSPSMISALKIIESNALNLDNAEAIQYYIKHFQLDHTELFAPFDLAPENDSIREVQELLSIQRIIQNDVSKLQSTLTQLNSLSIYETVPLILESIHNNDATAAKPLINLVQDSFSKLDSLNWPIIRLLISKSSISTQKESSISLYDYNNCPPLVDNQVFVLGLTSSNFPALSKRTGLLDEFYCARIAGFPVLSERTRYKLLQKENQLFRGDILTLSYHTTTYEGKKLDCSPTVKEIAIQKGKRFTPWTILEPDPFIDESHQLSEAIAHRLYLTDGLLRSSVSSLELYMNDPYAYFIQYGLKLTKPFDFALDARVIGTINHALVENKYKGTPDNPWEKYLPYLSRNDNYLPHLMSKNTENMNQHLNVLTLIDQEKTFTPFKSEVFVDESQLFPGLRMRGIIDRIDADDDALFIIDYKSSAHTLSEKRVLEGKQIQLLTYALIAEKEYSRPIFGVYYYAFTIPSLSFDAYAYAKSKGLTKNTYPTEEDFLKNMSLKGWTFMDPATKISNPLLFSGIRERKDESLYVFGGKMIFDQVKHILPNILNQIRVNILSGKLDEKEIEIEFDEPVWFKEGNES